MPASPRPGTRRQRALLAAVQSIGVCDDAVAVHLESTQGRPTDRTTICRSRSGEKYLSLDAAVDTVHLVAVERGEVIEEVALRLFGPLVREFGLQLVRPPEAVVAAEAAEGHRYRAMDAVDAAATLLREVRAAVEDGVVDDAERERLGELYEALGTLAVKGEIATGRRQVRG